MKLNEEVEIYTATTTIDEYGSQVKEYSLARTIYAGIENPNSNSSNDQEHRNITNLTLITRAVEEAIDVENLIKITTNSLMTNGRFFYITESWVDNRYRYRYYTISVKK